MSKLNRQLGRGATRSSHVPHLSTRQITALVIAILTAVVLVPVGAQAAQVVNAIITDPGGVNKAHVDASGNLQVGGTVGIDPSSNTVSVDSSTALAVTSVDDAGRMAFQHDTSADFAVNQFEALASFTVPRGKRLVIRYFSAVGSVPVGQTIAIVEITTQVAGESVPHYAVPVPTGSNGLADFFAVGQDTTLYADGVVDFRVDRTDDTGAGGIVLSVSGYLIDCSVAPCN
jgi:hypothetical protein